MFDGQRFAILAMFFIENNININIDKVDRPRENGRGRGGLAKLIRFFLCGIKTCFEVFLAFLDTY